MLLTDAAKEEHFSGLLLLMPSRELPFLHGKTAAFCQKFKLNSEWVGFAKLELIFLFSIVVPKSQPIVSFEKPTRLFLLETKDTISNYVSGFFALILVFLPIRVGR